MHILGRDLQSEEWGIHYKAIKDLKSYGNVANDYALYALQDKSDVISRLAQAWFVDHSKQALDYLIQKLSAMIKVGWRAALPE